MVGKRIPGRLGELDGAPYTLVVLTQCSFLNGEDAIFDGTENATSVFGSVLPVHLCVMTREEAISGECVVNFGFAAEDDIWLMLVDQCMELTILLLPFDTVTVHGQYCQGRRPFVLGEWFDLGPDECIGEPSLSGKSMSSSVSELVSARMANETIITE